MGGGEGIINACELILLKTPSRPLQTPYLIVNEQQKVWMNSDPSRLRKIGTSSKNNNNQLSPGPEQEGGCHPTLEHTATLTIQQW
jgi:hypothetical protein